MITVVFFVCFCQKKRLKIFWLFSHFCWDSQQKLQKRAFCEVLVLSCGRSRWVWGGGGGSRERAYPSGYNDVPTNIPPFFFFISHVKKCSFFSFLPSRWRWRQMPCILPTQILPMHEQKSNARTSMHKLMFFINTPSPQLRCICDYILDLQEQGPFHAWLNITRGLISFSYLSLSLPIISVYITTLPPAITIPLLCG